MTPVHSCPTPGIDCVLFPLAFRITEKLFYNYNLHGDSGHLRVKNADSFFSKNNF